MGSLPVGAPIPRPTRLSPSWRRGKCPPAAGAPFRGSPSRVNGGYGEPDLAVAFRLRGTPRGTAAGSDIRRPLGGGELDALRSPSVAIVGHTCCFHVRTRDRKAFSRAISRRPAAALSRASLLRIDAAAHEGALAAGITIGVLGGGHRHFFPRRNWQLAQRMLSAGGVVLSPFPPDQRAFPSQFLQRSGVVADLAVRSWALSKLPRAAARSTPQAGRPDAFRFSPFRGDIDRPHVAGCHALILDGVTLARNAQDVLDDLHLAKLPVAAPRSGRSPTIRSTQRFCSP